MLANSFYQMHVFLFRQIHHKPDQYCANKTVLLLKLKNKCNQNDFHYREIQSLLYRLTNAPQTPANHRQGQEGWCWLLRKDSNLLLIIGFVCDCFVCTYLHFSDLCKINFWAHKIFKVLRSKQWNSGTKITL